MSKKLPNHDELISSAGVVETKVTDELTDTQKTSETSETTPPLEFME